jgi:hypothetical protein
MCYVVPHRKIKPFTTLAIFTLLTLLRLSTLCLITQKAQESGQKVECTLNEPQI